jgi:hypothetical protein
MSTPPTKFGSLTLVRKLGESSTAETYEGFQSDGERGRVLVRRVAPRLLADPSTRQAIETRIRDLMGVKHPFLVPVLELLTPGGECLMVEQWVEALPISTVVGWCRQRGLGVPHNVFLNLSTQICNGLEALHGRPGKVSGNPNVLHMALRPSTLFVNLDGRILLGGYGLDRAPRLPTSDGDNTVDPSWVANLSPEQAEPDQKLIPASDIFSLATILFELLTLQSLFQAETALQTLNRLRRAEITTQLLGVKDMMPGLDKVLYRALSSSPRHRYQRAFVLREDLRGLMAGYSFANIADDTRRFLEPIVADHPFPSPTPVAPVVEAMPAPGPVDGFDDKVSTRIDPDPRSTAAYASQALAERAAREGQAQPGARPEPAPMPTSFPPPRSPRPAQPASTAAYIAQAQGVPLTDAGETILPPEDTPAHATPQQTAPPARELPPISPPPATTAVPLAQKPEPAAPAPQPVSRSDRLAAAAPPPGRTAEPAPLAAKPSPAPITPPPAVAAAPSMAPPPQATDTAGPPIHAAPQPPISDHEEDTGDWEPPKKRGGLMFLLVLVGLVLVVACAGGAWSAWNSFGAAWYAGRTELADLDVEIPDTPQPVVEDVPIPDEPEAPSLDGVADAAEMPDAAEVPEEQPEPATTAPTPASTTARDVPAYQGSSSTSSRSTTSRSSSSSSSSTSRSSSGSSGGSSGSSSYRSSSGSSSSSSSSSPSSSSYRSSSSSSSPASSSYAPSYTEPVSYDDGVSDLGAESSSSGPDDSNSLLERYSSQAATGSLGSSDIMVIEMVQPEDSAFTRSRLLLVMNAKAKGDAAAVKRYLDELSLRPENQYNPVVLTEYARYYVNKKDYQRALDKAVLAERHWARLPPELVFAKKAEIYEVEAAAYQGLFYRSEDNIDLLDKSIRQWMKYREHVMTESRTDLQARADREIEKLENIRDRLQ